MAEVAEAPAGALLSPSNAPQSPAPGSDAALQDIAIKTGDAIETGAIEGETRRDADTTLQLRKPGMRVASVRGGKVRFEEAEQQKSSL